MSRRPKREQITLRPYACRCCPTGTVLAFPSSPVKSLKCAACLARQLSANLRRLNKVLGMTSGRGKQILRACARASDGLLLQTRNPR